MKTIYTTLPIYDSLSKQAYERSKHEGYDNNPIGVLCPQNWLPSFQWRDNGDGCTAVIRIDTIDLEGIVTNITAYFPALPSFEALTDNGYFIYNSDTLNSDIDCGKYYLKITMNNAKVYYSDWIEVTTITNCLKFEFYNTCDLYNIMYQTGFLQTLWVKSETMEPSYPIEEEGVKNGLGQFTRTFARQTKKYSVRTFAMPDYMVDVFNRMRFHDTIELTDTVGDTNDVFNLEVEHEWLFEDKYYAQINLTFDYDETLVASACCNNLV